MRHDGPVLVDVAHSAARIAGAVLLVTVLGGCPGRPGESRVDQERVELLRGDPVLAGALEPPDAYPGWEINDGSWNRSEVSAPLGLWRSPVPGGIAVAEAERRIAEILATVRNTGWTLLHARCASGADGWRWAVAGYKVVAGVGIWFHLVAEIWPDGKGSSSILLRAPNRRDDANPFADAPAGLAAGQSCIERPGVVEPSEEDGVYLELASSYTEGATPDPSHR